jgi:mitogen-activated protein kinase kinase kinase
LTTNLPIDHGHHYQSSRSNPALSSPSSTSSPAVESTPPPSTPSLGAPNADLSGDPSIRQEPSIGASLNERADGTQVTVRPTGLFEKFKAHLPHRSSLQQIQQRTSTNGLIPNTVCYCVKLLFTFVQLIVFLAPSHRLHLFLSHIRLPPPLKVLGLRLLIIF